MLTSQKVISIALVVTIIGLLCIVDVKSHPRRNRNNRNQNDGSSNRRDAGRNNRHGGAHLARCDAGEYRCQGPTALCIPEDWKCDNDPDCPEGDDELTCVATCQEHEFMCTSGQCIPADWRCDSDNDCQDQSDEANCGANGGSSANKR